MAQKHFINNKQWAEIDGVLCKVTKFLRFDKTQEFEIIMAVNIIPMQF